MLLESQETFRYLAAAAADDRLYNRFGVIEPDLGWHTADVFEYRHHGFQKAFHVFSVVELEIAVVAVGEVHDEVLAGVAHAVFVKISGTEVTLCLPGLMVQGDEAFLVLKVKFQLLRLHIVGYESVGAIESFGLLPESAVDSFCCVTLFTGGLFVLCKPVVNERFEGIQLRAEVILLRHWIRFIEISHVNVFADSFPVQTSYSYCPVRQNKDNGIGECLQWIFWCPVVGLQMSPCNFLQNGDATFSIFICNFWYFYYATNKPPPKNGEYQQQIQRRTQTNFPASEC